jgi:hypothetical protein
LFEEILQLYPYLESEDIRGRWHARLGSPKSAKRAYRPREDSARHESAIQLDSNTFLSHMEYRKLGNTDMEVSVLSFGASSLGGVFHPVSLADCLETVSAALDAGIKLIDVSPAYGETL